MTAIGEQIKAFREARKLSQRELAKNSNISHSYVALVEKGSRTPEQDKLLAICSALELNGDETVELLHQAGYDSAPLARVDKVLNDALAELPPGSCCTLHVRDPFFPRELRLVTMPGVTCAETMYGFVSLPSTRKVLREGNPETYSEDAENDTQRRDTSIRLPDAIKDDEARRLFGDFVDREGIKSSARIVFRNDSESANDDSVEAVLFVNFRVRTPEDSVREQLRKLKEDLAREIPAVAEALRRQDAPVLQKALRVLNQAQEWPIAGFRDGDDDLTQYFELLLDAAMAAVDMDTGKGVGTIHLYDAENEILKLAASRGSIDPQLIGNANVQDVSLGRGVIAWVARRQRAVVIPDLESSKFGKIRVKIKEGVRSEIAVPMLAGELAGVLNLESTEPFRFDETHVRSLWFAANHAALAVRIYRQAMTNRKLAKLNRELVRWCSSAILRMHSKQSEPIDELSQIARVSLGAKHCDIWRFDANVPERFYGAGGSYKLDVSKPPRRGGWSDYVCRAKCAVWIAIAAAEPPLLPSRFGFDVSFWDGQRKYWSKTPPKAGPPDSLNQIVMQQGVRSELGLPILSESECVGVCWLKFDADGRARLGTEEMLLATQFAEGVGQLLKSLEKSAAPAKT